jgi:uncharacterized membrane protein
MLDNSLRAPKKTKDSENGVFGELWAVHGGGFYHSQKYMLGPKNEPLTKDLHWSMWEAYTTWISGFFLMAIVYWYGADIYLINPSIMALSQPVAIAISLGFLAGGWIIYDLLCKSALAKNDKLLGLVIFILVSIAAYALTHIFSGRGAFMTFGAMLGTIMAANVFFTIIPGQRKMVENLHAGEEVNPAPGIAGKQRSVHNTYFTLPVLFTMISNHYAMTYGSAWNWLLLIMISVAGALIRVYFVKCHFGKASKTPLYIAGALLFLCFIGMSPLMATKQATAPVTKPTTTQVATTSGGPSEAAKTFTAVQSIIKVRCASCHAATPTQPGFAAAPKGVVFDTPNDIVKQAAIINQQTVLSKVMPIGNLTKMIPEERALLAQWINNGAKQQ